LITNDGENDFDMHPLTLIGIMSDSKVAPPSAVTKNLVLNVPATSVEIVIFLHYTKASGVSHPLTEDCPATT
jgi:hypothetical protein